MKNSRMFLFLIFFLAFVLRSGFIIYYENGKMLTNLHFASDEESYDQIAVNFLNGKGFVTDEGLFSRRVPVYPLFLAGVYLIFGHSFVAVRFIQAAVGALTCLVIYLIAKKVFDEKIGLISLFISVLYYPFITQPAYLLTEVVFTFLLTVTLYFLLLSIADSSNKLLVFAGFLFGISILCRDSLVAFTFVILILLLMDKRFKLKEKILKAILFILAVSMVILPWAFRNYKIYHAIIPTTVGSGHTLYLGNNPLSTGGTGGEWLLDIDSIYPKDINNLFSVNADNVLKKRAIRFILKEPKIFLSLSLKKFINMWRPFYANARAINKIIMSIFYLPIIILGLIGMFLSLRWRYNAVLLVALVLYFTFIHMVTISEIRYRYPVMPCIIIFAAFILARIQWGKICLKR